MTEQRMRVKAIVESPNPSNPWGQTIGVRWESTEESLWSMGPVAMADFVASYLRGAFEKEYDRLAALKNQPAWHERD